MIFIQEHSFIVHGTVIKNNVLLKTQEKRDSELANHLACAYL